MRAELSEVSFIPTMGNLHAGHMSLLERAKTYNNHISVSIFINPLQFNDKDDYINYPKTLDSDLELLNQRGCDSVFIPDATILEGINKIKAPIKSSFLCGANRPGHFDGVLTIVNRLFEIVKPTYSFFGNKDYQQLLLISDYVLIQSERMMDLHYLLEIFVYLKMIEIKHLAFIEHYAQ